MSKSYVDLVSAEPRTAQSIIKHMHRTCSDVTNDEQLADRDLYTGTGRRQSLGHALGGEGAVSSKNMRQVTSRSAVESYLADHDS